MSAQHAVPDFEHAAELRQAVLDLLMSCDNSWLEGTAVMAGVLMLLLGECEDEALRREVGGQVVRNLRRVIDGGSVLPRETLQ